MKFLQKFTLSPILLTIYFVLNLWVVNFDQTPFYSIFRVLFQVFVVVVVVFLVSRILTLDWIKAALITDIFILLFFIYGHIYNVIQGSFGLEIGRHRYLLFASAIFLAVGVYLVLKTRKRIYGINLWINLVTTSLLLMILVQTIVKVSPQIKAIHVNSPVSEGVNELPETLMPGTIGDVYYIVLDSYGRQDLLQEIFDIDNSDFIRQLNNRGFVVPDCTLSNYDTTTFSLSSSLNMDYLDKLGVFAGQIVDDEAITFYEPIRNSIVREKFESLGYQFITFKTLYQFLNISDSDIYYDVEQAQPFYNKAESINFLYLFYNTTMMHPLIGLQKSQPTRFDFILDPIIRIFNPKADLFLSREYKLYDQHRFAITKMKELPEIPGSKFVYAHLFLTHSPFVYQIDGSMRKSFEDSSEAYRDQIIYSNGQFLEIIDRIIKKSSVPPIIILQGDHSYKVEGERRLQILNAYYLPDGGSELVYPTITPVNTFRLILSYYFGEDLPFLPDKSYYREMGDVTYLREAENACQK